MVTIKKQQMYRQAQNKILQTISVSGRQRRSRRRLKMWWRSNRLNDFVTHRQTIAVDIDHRH